MIKLFILVVQVLRMIGRWLERRGLLKEAVRRAELDIDEQTDKMLNKAVSARGAVSDDPDSMRDDPRNLDNAKGQS